MMEITAMGLAPLCCQGWPSGMSINTSATGARQRALRLRFVFLSLQRCMDALDEVAFGEDSRVQIPESRKQELVGYSIGFRLGPVKESWAKRLLLWQDVIVLFPALGN